MLNRKRAHGFTNIEVMVSGSLVLVTIGALSSMVPRLGNVWKASRNHQLATHELANQLETLTAIPESQLSHALENIQVSADLTNCLQGAVLSQQLLDDEHGRRIVLSMEWDRVADAKPISMVAWLPKSDSRGTP